jgi:hypothetical protein
MEEYKLNKYNELLINFVIDVTDEYGSTTTQPANPETGVTVMVGLVALLSRSGLNEAEPVLNSKTPSIIDSTDYLSKQSSRVNEQGQAVINLDKTFLSTEAYRFYQNYYQKYTIALKIVIEVPKSEIYASSITSDNILVKWTVSKYLQFDSINYSEYNDDIYLESVGNNIVDFVQLRSTLKTAEESYLLIKKRYDSELLSSTTDLELPISATYEPASFSQVITRLLEFQEGTLIPGLSHAEKLNLDVEYKRLDTMNKIVNIVTGMYPKITIEDGEGIPYNK